MATTQERILELRAERANREARVQELVEEKKSLEEQEKSFAAEERRLREVQKRGGLTEAEKRNVALELKAAEARRAYASKQLKNLTPKIKGRVRFAKQIDSRIDRLSRAEDVRSRDKKTNERLEEEAFEERVEFFRGIQEERRAVREARKKGEIITSEAFQELAIRRGVITPTGRIIDQPLGAEEQRRRMFGVPEEPLKPTKTRIEQTKTFRLTTIPKRITKEGLQERETAFFPVNFMEQQKRVRRGQMALDTQYEIIARNAQGDVPFAKQPVVLSGFVQTRAEGFKEEDKTLTTLRAERELSVERAQAARARGDTPAFLAASSATLGQTFFIIPSALYDFSKQSTKGIRTDIENPDVRISGAVRKRIIGVGEKTYNFVTRPSVGPVALAGAGFAFAKKTYDETARKFSERPAQVVGEALAYDLVGRGTLRAFQGTKFIGKKFVPMSKTVDPQSYFGVSEDVLQEVRYPVSQADVVTTRRTQAQGSERIIEQITAPSRDRLIRERIRQDKIREASGFGSRVFDFEKATVEKGLLYQASPEPLPTTLVNGRQRITLLSKEQLEELLGAKQASDAGGLFASDKASTAFLGLDGESRVVEISLIPKINNPAIQRIEGSAARLPKDARKLTAKEAEELFQRPDLLPEDYDFYITAQREIALKTEKEVKAPAGTILEQTKEYTPTQRAFGRDFDEYTLVPSRIPTGNLDTVNKIIDPDTGKIVSAGGRTIGIPRTGFRLVPIREFKVLGRTTPTTVGGTTASSADEIKRIYSRSPTKTVTRSPTGFFKSSRGSSTTNFRSSSSFFSRSSSLASRASSSLASRSGSSASMSSASRSLTSRSSSSSSSGGSSYGYYGGGSSTTTILRPEKIELDKPDKKTKKALKKRKKTRYLPSLTGIDRGIKQTKKSAEGFTGIELRGI